MRARRDIRPADGARRGARPRLAALVTTAVAVTVLAGCTASEGETPAQEAADPAASAAPEAPSTPDPLPVGPLDALLDTVDQVDIETPEAQLARLRRSEEIVSECMAEQGFEYAQTDWASVLDAQSAREASWEKARMADPGDPVEAAREYGYGIFVVVEDTEDVDGAGGGFVDPNAERVAAMSRAEQQAWELALYGTGQGEEYIAGDEPYDWTKYGCFGVSDHELGVDQREFFDDSAWADLRLQIDMLRATLADDPAMAQVRAAWVACMDAAGHPGYAGVDEPVAELLRRSEEIWTEASAGVHLDLSTDDYLTDPAYLEQQAQVTARNAEMAPLEIELAVADVTCRAEAGYEDREAQVWLDVQEEFYAEHRADLDAWVAAFEEFEARNG